MIPYGRQSISDEDIRAVIDVLKSDFLTQGPAVPAFEKAVCDYTKAQYAVAVNSGTSALHVACLALGLGEGDWLWTTPISFVASANCGLYCGAKVDFVDIDPESWNLSISSLKAKLAQAKEDNKLPKILVAVHLCGLSCDMQTIHTLSREYGFAVIEDASHAIGGKYAGLPVGNGQYSDITVFSFHPVKNITTGEGGMAVTNKEELWNKMSLFRSHGITREPSQMTKPMDGSWYYQQIALGYNYRMTDIQAALGISQLHRLDDFIYRRQQIAAIYNRELTQLPLQLPYMSEEVYSAFHLYVVRLKLDRLRDSHAVIFKKIRELGIGVNLHYIPIHTQPYYQELGFADGDYPEAENYYASAISLPMYPDLSDDQVSKICATVAEVLLLK